MIVKARTNHFHGFTFEPYDMFLLQAIHSVFNAPHLLILVKGSQLETHNIGYRLKNRLDEPVFIAGPKPMLTEFDIHQILDWRVVLT